ncbi:MAG TPA: YciI family protein [Streptosporangiaceae bacterium]|jgi:hypothetical protein|nr:YciI family protein [Streptosporangiaceae bacterium]
MKYMFLICVDGSIKLTDEQRANAPADGIAWATEMDNRGIRIEGNALQATSDATTVRVRSGEVLLADGPFAETKEFVAGFDLMDCADLDEAIEAAAKHPCAAFGAVEIRPLWQP